jgi:hypothetical protein
LAVAFSIVTVHRFLAVYLVCQTKTGIFSLEINRELSRWGDTAWLIHNKTPRVMENTQAEG